jgi:hypothetical protein
MPVTKSRSRINAEAFYQQQQEATNRAIEQGWGGIGGYLFGPSKREQADIGRASEAEQYALERMRADGQALEQLPQLVAGADALARAGGAMPQDLPDAQRAGYGINLAQQMRAGITPTTAGAAMAGNQTLNPTVAGDNRLRERALDLQESGQQLQARGLDLQAQGLAQGDSGEEFQKAKFGQGMIDTQQQRFLSQMAGPAQIADATQRITGSLATGNAIGGLAAIIGLAKVLDPTSVVREGEVTTIQGGMGVGQSLMDAWNRAQSQGFSPESAKDLQSVVDANAIPVLQRAIRQRQEFSTSLDQVFGEQYPGVGRVVTGSGIDWDWVNQYTGTDAAQNPPGPKVVTYGELQGQ